LKRKKKTPRKPRSRRVGEGDWCLDEFYGSGKPTDKASKKQRGKRKANASNEEERCLRASSTDSETQEKHGRVFSTTSRPSMRSQNLLLALVEPGKKRKADIHEDHQQKSPRPSARPFERTGAIL